MFKATFCKSPIQFQKPQMKFFLFVLMLLLLSCDLTDDSNNEVICTTEYVYRLNVTIKDDDNNSVIMDDIVVTAKDGD